MRLRTTKTRVFLSFLFAFACSSALGQNYFRIVEDNKVGVPNAHVYIENSQSDTVILTSTRGAFILSSSMKLPISIQVSYIGYKTIHDTLYKKASKKYVLEPDNISLNEFAVTAQYNKSNPDKAVQNIKIIDQKKIEAMAAVNLEDVLSNELNIRLSRDNILGSSMSMQGLSGQNIKFMIDGIPIKGRQDGNIDLSQINLNDVQRIEIVQGALSVSYGTNALAGTINIITKKNRKEGFGLHAQGYTENIGTYNFTGGGHYKKGMHNIKISGGRNFFDGWHPNDQFWDDTKPQLADTNRVKTWNPKTQTFGRVQYQIGKNNWSIRYQPAIFHEAILNRGRPQAPYNEVAFDDRYVTWRVDQALTADLEWNEKNNLKILAAYNLYKRRKNTRVIDLTTLEQDLTENPQNHDTTSLHVAMSRGTYSWSGKKWLQFELGYHLTHEWITGPRFEQQKDQGDYALFASTELTAWNQLVFRPGLRYSYNTAYNAPITPALNIKWGEKNWSIRGSYARGFRAPSLKELYFYFVDANHNIVGNEDLTAEKSHSTSLNLQWKKLKNNRLFQVELGGFYNYLENQITLAQITSTRYSYINVGLYKTTGGSIKFSGLIQHFKWNIGATYTGRLYSVAADQFKDKFLGSPEFKTSLNYEWEKIGMNFSVFYKYQGALPRLILTSDNQVQQGEIPAYNMLDCSISKSFFNKQLVLQSGLKNILNIQNLNAGLSEANGTHNSGPSTPIANGRILFFKVKYQWNSK